MKKLARLGYKNLQTILNGSKFLAEVSANRKIRERGNKPLPARNLRQPHLSLINCLSLYDHARRNKLKEQGSVQCDPVKFRARENGKVYPMKRCVYIYVQ